MARSFGVASSSIPLSLDGGPAHTMFGASSGLLAHFCAKIDQLSPHFSRLPPHRFAREYLELRLIFVFLGLARFNMVFFHHVH